MALPPSAASALAADMPSKGFGTMSKDGPSSEPAPEDDGKPDVYEDIAGDFMQAMTSGDKAEAAKFLREFVERCMGSGSTEEE